MLYFRFCFLLGLVACSSLFAGQKAVLINDTSSWYHWGCTGTSTALKEGIEKIGFEVVAIPVNTTYALKEVPEFGEFNHRQKFEQFCKANQEILEAIKSADAVLITGEGTIHDMRSGPRALLYLAYISGKFLAKHVEIINHSAYPKDDPVLSDPFLKNVDFEKDKRKSELKQAQELYKTVYSKLDFVAIREPFSQAEMGNIGVLSTLSFDCLPLYIRDHCRTPKDVKEKTLVLAGSVAFTEESVSALCRYAEEMEKKGFKIKVLIGAAAYPARDDQMFVERIKEHCKAPLEIINAASLDEWMDTINQASLFVSGRFHHSIAAFCLNTPFIALNSNTHKVHAICSLLGEAEPLLYSSPELLGQLIVRTEMILCSPNPNNEKKIAEICQLADRNFDGLRKLIED